MPANMKSRNNLLYRSQLHLQQLHFILWMVGPSLCLITYFRMSFRWTNGCRWWCSCSSNCGLWWSTMGFIWLRSVLWTEPRIIRFITRNFNTIMGNISLGGINFAAPTWIRFGNTIERSNYGFQRNSRKNKGEKLILKAAEKLFFLGTGTMFNNLSIIWIITN